MQMVQQIHCMLLIIRLGASLEKKKFLNRIRDVLKYLLNVDYTQPLHTLDLLVCIAPC